MSAVYRLLGAAAAGALGAATGFIIDGQEAAIALGVCSAVVALPFRWTHPHRWRQLNEDIPAHVPEISPVEAVRLILTRPPSVEAEKARRAKEDAEYRQALTGLKEVTSADIVQSLFLGICPDEQTQTVTWFEEPSRPHVRSHHCRSCNGVWEVRLAKARHMRDYEGFDVEKVK